ncbi:hypothetical protein AHAS_Ahas11G0120900 [Arachis hypogaea]
MSWNRDKEPLLDFDPEPGRTLRRHLQQTKAYKVGENLMKTFEKLKAGGNANTEEKARKVLGSYTAPSPDFYGRSISVPAIGANNFEFKPQLVTLICDTVKTNEVNPEKEEESLYETWERYKQMIRRFPSDMVSDWTRLQIFYDDLSEMAKMSLDHSAGELIEMVANNQYIYTSERNSVNTGTIQKRGVMEVDILNAILMQNKLMSQ